ncbi:MAG: hypothetical protein VX951_09160 [Planctomycetota bacterium]|nr:hypothetical protein [Planctomycetota bacterium]
MLHLISLGAVGGMVMAGLQLKEHGAEFKRSDGGQVKEVKSLRARSKTNSAGSGGWNYRSSEFWMQLSDANFTGRVRPEDKPEVKDPDAEKKPLPGVIDLNDILHVIAITYGDGLNGAVVNYSASVEVPDEFRIDPNVNVINTIPEGRRRRSKTPRVPTRSVASSPPHHMKIGDPLWAPYEHVFLHGIATDASEVDFELRIAKGDNPEQKNLVQTLLKNQLGLPAEILQSLVKGKPKPKSDSDDKGDATKKPDDGSGYQWVDQPTTFLDKRGNVNISKKDSQWLSRDGGQIFNEDVHMRDYSSGSGNRKVRGIQLRKLSPRVRQFGAQEGDVVISINNAPVKGMASAKRLGRRLYNKGVRSFRVEIMRRGERQTLYYHLKKGQ